MKKGWNIYIPLILMIVIVSYAFLISGCEAYESKNLLERAKTGDAEAQYRLAVYYYKKNNLEGAYHWYLKSAEQGNLRSQFNLGIMYHAGQGVPQSYSEALKWWHKAAEQGHAKSQFVLGSMYHRADGVAQNYSEALKWYRRAAEQGHAESQFTLGRMYHSADGVTQNYTEATKWYRKAAEQKYAESQFVLGTMYHRAEGVVQNYSEALKWYRRAAEQGHAESQFVLGRMYHRGEGVAKSYSEAIKWYSKAAEKGHTQSKHILAVINDEADDGKYAASLDTQRRANSLYKRVLENGAIYSEIDLKTIVTNSVGFVIAAKGTGSGFVISADGLFVTCYHVIEGSEKVQVSFEKDLNKSYPASVIAVDIESDLALLEIEGDGFVPVMLEQYGEETEQRNEEVLVAGFPLIQELGINKVNFTKGNVSNVVKRISNGVEIVTYQLNCNAYPGNSGGPVFNTEQKKVIGFLMGGYRDKAQGVNVAVSIQNLYTRIFKQR